ncbi:MAG: tetratricopeptide repeat protein [Myxococcota bacterium]
MSVVEIHPEELLDKRAAGTLSAAEEQHLNAHLARCEVCRFELALRADLDEDFATRRASLPAQLLNQMPLTEPRIAPRRMRRWSLAWGWAVAVFALAAGALGSYAAPRVWPWISRQTVQQSVALQASSGGASLAKHRTRNAAPAPVAVVAPVASASAPSSASPVPSAAPVVPQPQPQIQPKHDAATSPQRGLQTAAVSNSEESAQALFSSANSARRAGDVTRARELYSRLQRKFPGSPEASLSRVTLSTLLLSSDPAAALAGFDSYLASSGPLAAEALVGRARALRALGRNAESLRVWNQVQTRYPTSVYAEQAREMTKNATTP